MSNAIFLCGCPGTIRPKPVVDQELSFDESTPSQYPKQNGGLLDYTEKGALITVNALDRYNHLIFQYRKKYEREYGRTLKMGEGVEEVVDKHGNRVYEISNQHFVIFGILNGWRKSKIEPDK